MTIQCVETSSCIVPERLWPLLKGNLMTSRHDIYGLAGWPGPPWRSPYPHVVRGLPCGRHGWVRPLAKQMQMCSELSWLIRSLPLGPLPSLMMHRAKARQAVRSAWSHQRCSLEAQAQTVSRKSLALSSAARLYDCVLLLVQQQRGPAPDWT